MLARAAALTACKPDRCHHVCLFPSGQNLIPPSSLLHLKHSAVINICYVRLLLHLFIIYRSDRPRKKQMSNMHACAVCVCVCVVRQQLNAQSWHAGRRIAAFRRSASLRLLRLQLGERKPLAHNLLLIPVYASERRLSLCANTAEMGLQQIINAGENGSRRAN